MGAALLDIDTCSERLARVAMASSGLDPNNRDSPQFKQRLRDPIYETLFDIAAENLPHLPCVIVGPFTRERRCASWPCRLRERLGAPVRIVVVRCNDEERRRRLVLRSNVRDTSKLQDWERYAALGVDPGPPPFEHELVDTSEAPGEA